MMFGKRNILEGQKHLFPLFILENTEFLKAYVVDYGLIFV